MQRQAVPLLRARSPYVGTGMEYITARDSGAVVVARAPAPSTTSTASASSCASKGRAKRSRRQQGDGRRHLPDDQVQAVEPEHLHQPEADRPRRTARAEGPGAGRRSVHRAGRAGARPQRARRVHAVARLQLRGRDPRLREDGEGGLLHLHPHRGVRDRGARHQARPRGDHAGHPERVGDATCATSTTAASSASAPTSSRATSWSARSRRRARRSSRPKRSCSARSSARRPATSATPRSSARRASRASSSA